MAKLKEIWLPVVGYESGYEVSNYGNVRSLARKINRSSTLMNIRERVLTKSIYNTGYYYVALCGVGKPKKATIHKIVAKAFIPNPDNKPYINHIDGNKLNNYVDNLEWCSPKENNLHARETGLARWAKGKDAPTSREVINIKTGERFCSIRDAAKSSGLCEKYLSNNLRISKRKRTDFRYYDEKSAKEILDSPAQQAGQDSAEVSY